MGEFACQNGFSSGHARISLVRVWAVLCLLWPVGALAVEFPGPIALTQEGASLSLAPIRLAGAGQDYFVAGTDKGFLKLYRFNPTSQSFTALHTMVVGGQVESMVPWQVPNLPPAGLVVATVNPDRLLFVQVNESFPYLEITAELALPEDPGDVAFTGVESGGAAELMVALPGLDQVLEVGQVGGQWAVLAAIPVGDGPTSMTDVDLDDDGVQELVLAQTGPLSRTLGILRRQPDGTYQLETLTLPGGAPGLVAAFDSDGDGRRELVVSGAETPVVKFYLENDGALVETGHADLTIAPQSLYLARVSGSIPGLFAARESRGVVEFATWADGGWQPQDTFYPGCLPRSLALADVDGDGLDDLIAAGGDGNLLTIMLGDERPGFAGFPALRLERKMGSFVNDDLDGDGYRDLLVADIGGNTLSLMRGGPGGTLGPEIESLAVGFNPGFVLAADLTDAPGVELAVLDVGSAEVVVFDYDAASGLTSLSRTAVGVSPFFIAAGDVDADGAVDLMVLSQDIQEAWVLFGDGAGGVAETVRLGFDNPAHWIVALDLNADGLPELAATDAVNRVWVVHNTDGRHFGTPEFANAGAGALQMSLGDLDGDLDQDLVVANRLENSLTFFENDGSGTLVRKVGSYALPGQPAGIVLADFDGNGRLDVLANLRNSAHLGVVLGASDWSYFPPLEFAGGPDMSGIAVSDFNLDGAPDILALDQTLLLGLVLLNGKPGQVAVAPTALVAECAGESVEFRIRPDRPGPWQLELLQGGAWRTVMVDGQALTGRRDFDAGTWFLILSREELMPWLVGGRTAVEARLTVGAGSDRESEVWSLALDCLGRAGSAVPRISWQREPWPNPFNPLVRARINLERSGKVEVAVFDPAGRKLAVLAAGSFPAGSFDVTWDGTAAGRPVSAGLYLMRVVTPGGRLQRKLMLIK